MNTTAIILQILPRVGAKERISDYIRKATALCSGCLFPSAKAYGSLGGAKNGGSISIQNGYVTRIR